MGSFVAVPGGVHTNGASHWAKNESNLRRQANMISLPRRFYRSLTLKGVVALMTLAAFVIMMGCNSQAPTDGYSTAPVEEQLNNARDLDLPVSMTLVDGTNITITRVVTSDNSSVLDLSYWRVGKQPIQRALKFSHSLTAYEVMTKDRSEKLLEFRVAQESFGTDVTMTHIAGPDTLTQIWAANGSWRTYIFNGDEITLSFDSQDDFERATWLYSVLDESETDTLSQHDCWLYNQVKPVAEW